MVWGNNKTSRIFKIQAMKIGWTTKKFLEKNWQTIRQTRNTKNIIMCAKKPETSMDSRIMFNSYYLLY